MQDYVHSGYFHIYRPPYSLANEIHRSTIYCVSDRFNTALVIIPLVPSFYKGVIDLVKQHTARQIYIVAPDIGIAFVSDYYLAWDTITKTLRRSCKIISKFMPENFTRGDFKSDIIRTENDNISIEIPRSKIDVGTIDISLTKAYVSSRTPFSCDVILNDTYKKRVFVGEMNEHKAKFLAENIGIYDEIHMAYITGTYGGYTYNDLIKEYPALKKYIYCNQFASSEEYYYAKSQGIQIGGAYNNDFI